MSTNATLSLRLAGGVIAAAIASIAGIAHAGAFQDCVTTVADMDLTAKTTFQTDFRNLVVREKQQFEPLANLNMELQIALAQARRIKLDHLLRTEPARLETTKGMSRFSNFDWNDADTARLAQADSVYRALTDKIKALESRNNAHPDWPKLRQFYADTLAKLPPFSSIMKQLQASREKSESRLAECPKPYK